jgi:hypothetical protein
VGVRVKHGAVDEGTQPLADKQPKRRKPLVFKAATIAHVKVPKVELSDSTIEEVISILGVMDEGWVRALRTVLPKQAQAYMLAKVIVNADNPHRSKKAMVCHSFALAGRPRFACTSAVAPRRSNLHVVALGKRAGKRDS